MGKCFIGVESLFNLVANSLSDGSIFIMTRGTFLFQNLIKNSNDRL